MSCWPTSTRMLDAAQLLEGARRETKDSDEEDRAEESLYDRLSVQLIHKKILSEKNPRCVNEFITHSLRRTIGSFQGHSFRA